MLPAICKSRVCIVAVVGQPGRLRGEAGATSDVTEAAGTPTQKRRGISEHGPGVKVISPGCAARASFVITINTCTYKTKYKLFLPSKRLKTLLSLLAHHLARTPSRNSVTIIIGHIV